jgi:hypothetical protein
VRCSFQENFIAKLLFRYSVTPEVYRYTRLVLPMTVKSSFKITLQHDQSVEQWRFTLSVLEYFKGVGAECSLQVNQVLCLNEQWSKVLQPTYTE